MNKENRNIIIASVLLILILFFTYLSFIQDFEIGDFSVASEETEVVDTEISCSTTPECSSNPSLEEISGIVYCSQSTCQFERPIERGEFNAVE